MNNKKIKKPLTAKKIISYILSAIILAVFVLVLIAFIAILAQVIQGKTPTFLGYRFYYVLTDSMSPTIEPKQVIISKVIDDYDNIDEIVNEGDIITFIETFDDGSTKINTHRVVKDVYYDETLGDYYVQTKGDNPRVGLDKPIKVTAIQAVMKGKVPALSAIYKAVTSSVGMILFLIIPFVFILGVLVYKLVIIIKNPTKVEEKEKDIEQIKKEIAKKAVEEYINSHKNDEE